MCTVSYLPLANGYILTSNRDEDPSRNTANPDSVALANGMVVTAPVDLEKGGSWIAIDEAGRAACLLNGAFEKHIRELPYRKSRGQLVFDAFNATDFDTFSETVTLDGIEPFTLLLAKPQRLLKLVWDGSRKYLWALPADSTHLWSSPTLYNPAQHAEKERYFKDAMLTGSREAEYILKIHGKDGNTPFVLNRPGVRTVSITQVKNMDTGCSMDYFIKNKKDEKAISVIGTSY